MKKILKSSILQASAMVRRLFRLLRQLKMLSNCLAPLWRHPQKIRATFARMVSAWERGGILAVKQLLTQLPSEVGFDEIWLRYQDTITLDVEASILDRIARMQQPPRISILMPVFHPLASGLRGTIESVLNQLYPDWELCVVVASSPQFQSREFWHTYSNRDSRIHVEFSDSSVGMADATNRALAMATGSLVTLLDVGDFFETQALFRLAECVIDDSPDLIYTDGATLSENGRKVIDHVYRPSFSLEMLRSCPYISHLIAFKTTLLRELGGMDTALDTSLNYDLILRASEKSQVIVHIPQILYLQRQRTKAYSPIMQREVTEVSRQMLTRHLERCGERGNVKDGLLVNYFEVRYPLELGQRVAIIIPTKNHGELVRQCIESIERTVTGVPYDILVVDHESTDPATLAYFKQLNSRHRVLRYEGPFNFSCINNWAVKQLDERYTHYLFCNNDIEATELGWLERMMELCQKLDVGVVGAKLFYPGGRIFQHAGVCVGMFGIAEHYAKFMDERLPDGSFDPGYHGTLIVSHEVSAVTAACALMRRDAFDCIGGFDEAIAVGFGDVDLCLRARNAGYRVVFCPHAALTHHESFTRGKSDKDPHPEDSAFFAKRWRKFLDQGDPYYNPNLAIHSTKWDVRLPLEFNLDIRRRVTHNRSHLKS